MASTAALEREKLKLTQRIRDAETALERQNGKLDASSKKLQDAGVNVAELTGESERLEAQLKELHEAQDKVADSAGGFGKRAAAAFETVGGALTAAGIAAGLHEIASAYMECVTVAADFEEAMSTVEALSGASPEEMASLTAEAKELGATTKFTARQAADAMGYMGMAGWNAGEMLSGMNGVIHLTAASGEDLAQVSDIVTDNLTAFGLKASDTAHFADVLAAAATNSNTSVRIMGETFKNSASLAGALNYSVEDVAVAVGLMANAGIKGERAGTALKNIFSNLIDTVTLTGDAFGEVEYSAVTADGSMKDFGTTIQELRGYFAQMTGAEKMQNAELLVGKEAMAGFVTLMNATDEDFRSLYESVTNCTGAAERMAQVKLDNLAGDITLMDSAMEALQTTIGEQFNPELRKLTQLGTGVLNWADGFIKENPELVSGVMAGAGAFAAMGTAIVGLNAAIKAFQALKLASLFTGAGKFFAIAGGIAAVVGTIAAASAASKEAEEEVQGLTAASREQYREMERLRAEYDAACESLGETSEEALRLRYQLDDASASFEENRQTVDEFAAECQDVIDAHAAMTEELDRDREAVRNNSVSTMALVQKLEDLSSGAYDAANSQEVLQIVIDQLNGSVEGLNLTYSDLVLNQQSTIENVRAMAKAQAEMNWKRQLSEEYVTLYGDRALSDRKLNEADAAVAAAQKRVDDARAAYLRIQDERTNGGTDLADATLLQSDEYKELQRAQYDLATATEKRTGLQNSLADTDRRLLEIEGELGLRAEATADDALREAAALKNVDGVIENTVTLMKDLAQSYAETYEAARESMEGQFSLWDMAAEVIPASVADLTEALQSQSDYWADYNTNLQTLLAHSDDIAGLSEMVASFADGSAESVNVIAGLADALNEGEGGVDKVRELVNTWTDTQTWQDAAAESLALLAEDLPGQMEEFQKIVQEGADGLDISDDVRDKARNAINAFIDEAKSQDEAVRSAYAELGKAAADGLGVTLAPIVIHGGGGGGGGRLYVTENAYASGTDSAVPGYAWVGEDGPELMRMRGGEQILPNRASVELAESWQSLNERPRPVLQVAETGYSASGFNVELHLHIEAGASPETVDAWQDYVSRGELREVILETLEDADADLRRRSMV